MSNQIRFLLSRLKNASIAELTHRVREAVLIFRHQHRVRYGDAPLSVPSLAAEDVALLSLPAVVSDLSLAELEELLHGATCCLNVDAGTIKAFETRVGKTYFARIRQVQGDPDIRAVWEPARLQHVMALLLHANQNPVSALTERSKAYTKNCIFDWIKRNPFLYGPHYMSAMECGLRIPVFFSTLKGLALDERETDTLLSTIYHHAWWIEKRLSLYSSIGNHTICECVGLVFAGAVFIKTVDGARWLDKGVGLLREEIIHQILPDGGPVEQSLSYHRFVLDLYWLAIDFLERNNLADCGDFKPHLMQGEEFLAAFIDEKGEMPALGDSDDGFAVAPGVFPIRCASPSKKKEFHHFSNAGYSVVRLDKGIMLTFDHGPLGMEPLYNHGHADALAVTLSVKGKQMLVDCGTYRYNGVPQWRRYFKGTRAHNTVIIDNLDQAIQATGFIWENPYAAQLVSSRRTELGMYLEARHNGYSRLHEPVEHRRRLLCSNEGWILVKDIFSGIGKHVFELNFHLHPEAIATEQDGWWNVVRDESWLAICLLDDDNLTCICGQESPPLGWYSPAYGIKHKSSVLQRRRTGTPDSITFTTAIFLMSEPNKDKVYHHASAL